MIEMGDFSDRPRRPDAQLLHLQGGDEGGGDIMQSPLAGGAQSLA